MIDINSTRKVPLVSIGMPVFNGEKYICEALDSLLAQSFMDFELILSDNNSTDRTQDICIDYAKKDKRIRYIRQMENIGPSKNFLFVFNQSVGDYFMWAAGDDVWDKNWIQELIAEITPECLSVRGSVVFFSQYRQNFKHITSFSKGQFLKYFIEDDTLAKCHHIYGLFHRKKLLKANFNLLEIDYAGDVIFVCNLLRLGDLKVVDTTRHFYRQHDSNQGANLVKSTKRWKRVLYQAYPISYYIGHLKALPFPQCFYLSFFIPFKYFKSQFELWFRVAYRIKSILINTILLSRQKK
jgi:glycosyltransferase involved in cell wall biosynthesis